MPLPYSRLPLKATISQGGFGQEAIAAESAFGAAWLRQTELDIQRINVIPLTLVCSVLCLNILRVDGLICGFAQSLL